MKRSLIKRKSKPSSAIRKSARGEDCTMQIEYVCNGNPETVVWAHSNNLIHGKGMGLKANDENGCYACSSCHAFYDGGYANYISRDEVEEYFDQAMERSLIILKRKGLV